MINISEKKLIVFLTSLQKHLSKPRINLFARMIGLIPADSILLEEFIFYIKSLYYIIERSCTKEKIKATWKMGEKKGKILLKNIKLNSFFYRLESCVTKKSINRFKKSIEKESQMIGKDRFYNVDNILKSAIMLRRKSYKSIKIYLEIFNTIKTMSTNLVYPSVFFLMCKHFFTTQVNQEFEIQEMELKQPLAFEDYVILIGRIIKNEVIDIDRLLSKNLSNMSNRLSMISNSKLGQSGLKASGDAQVLFKSIDPSDLIKSESIIKVDDYDKFFNIEKVNRAKLTKEGVDLKMYFQEHLYEIKSDLIKYYKKLNFSTSKYNNALRFLFSKVARKFDEYTFYDISEFFITFYIIKKEININ
jgi:hypothetical protein